MGEGGYALKVLWRADECFEEDLEGITGWLLLLARWVEKPAWHAAATCSRAGRKLQEAKVFAPATQIPTTLLFCLTFSDSLYLLFLPKIQNSTHQVTDNEDSEGRYICHSCSLTETAK